MATRRCSECCATTWTYRDEVRLRHGVLRRVHRAHRRQADVHVPGTFHPPHSIELRIARQFGDSLIDRVAEFDGCEWIVLSDVVNNGVPVGLG